MYLALYFVYNQYITLCCAQILGSLALLEHYSSPTLLLTSVGRCKVANVMLHRLRLVGIFWMVLYNTE